MAVRCPSKDCNTKMYVPDNLLHNPGANVKCTSCKKMFKPFDTLPQNVRDEIMKKRQQAESTMPKEGPIPTAGQRSDDIVGWIVVHDENTHTQTYELKLGRQVIGRKSTTKPCDIMIDTNDSYMSRNHFVISISQRGGRYSYLIEDYQATNSTYIDTRRLSEYEREMKRLGVGEQVYIEDGSLIQAGRTKIVLKTLRTVSNKEDATRIVSQEKITKTIIL